MSWRNAAGAEISFTYADTTVSVVNAWTDVIAKLTAPVGAVRGIPRVLRVTSASNVNNCYMSRPRVARRNAAELLVDGSIVADMISAGAVVTDKLAATAVIASKIAAGAIVASKIQAGSITTSHFAADQIITQSLIVDGAVSAKYFLTRYSNWAISAVGSANRAGIGVNVIVSFSPRSNSTWPNNPVMATLTLDYLSSAGSGTVVFVLDWENSSGNWSIRATFTFNYYAGRTVQPVGRILDGTGYGNAPLPNGRYRIAAYLTTGSDPVDVGGVVLSMEQLNK